MKSIYISQPYAVGSKTGKSLAFVIPHEVVLHYRLSPSTIIILRTENLKKKIILEALENEETQWLGYLLCCRNFGLYAYQKQEVLIKDNSQHQKYFGTIR
jgi:hypothetical protein